VFGSADANRVSLRFYFERSDWCLPRTTATTRATLGWRWRPGRVEAGSKTTVKVTSETSEKQVTTSTFVSIAVRRGLERPPHLGL
jgi:hypothetical protein